MRLLAVRGPRRARKATMRNRGGSARERRGERERDRGKRREKKDEEELPAGSTPFFHGGPQLRVALLVFIFREGPSRERERGALAANIRRNPPYSVFEQGPQRVARLAHSVSLSLSHSIWSRYNNIDVSLALAHEERRELELVLGACMANEEVLPFHRGGQLPADLRGIF